MVSGSLTHSNRNVIKLCLTILALAIIGTAVVNSVFAVRFAGSITFQPQRNNALSSIIDTVHDAIYFGTSTGYVVKVQLSTFTEISSIKLSTGIDLTTALIDYQHGFAYFGTDDVSPSITKIDLNTFTEVAHLSVPWLVYSGVLNSTSQLAYFGNHDNVHKLDLSTFSTFSGVSLSGIGNLRCAIIQNNTAYFGDDSSPANVAKINLASFTWSGTLTLNNGENVLRAAVVDEVNNQAYFGTSTNPGKVVRINLATFTETGTLTLGGNGFPTGQGTIHSATNDTFRGNLYFGLSSGGMSQVAVSSFTETGGIDTGSGVDFVSAAMDPSNVYAYFGTSSSPAQVFKFDVRPPATSVGGTTVPIDRLSLVLQYLLFPGLIVAGSVSFIVLLYRRRK